MLVYTLHIIDIKIPISNKQKTQQKNGTKDMKK